jgi:formylglycine-generating enzyme required for sulfatase activity
VSVFKTDTVYYKKIMQQFDIFENLPFTAMIKIPKGDFIMGDNNGIDRKKPEHPVHVPSFYIGKYPVTQALWEKVMGNNPSRFKGKNRPVTNISWNDIYEKDGFLDKLNELIDFEGKFRLLSEAEWEYAARANQNYIYSGSNDLETVGWYNDNSYQETNPVGLKNPNDFGLYDMSGNVWEWCEDHSHSNYENAPDDGTAWIDDTTDESLYRVQRGGSCFYFADYCRSAYRRNYHPSFRLNSLGFRLGFQVQWKK